jgi:hypothetical protein
MRGRVAPYRGAAGAETGRYPPRRPAPPPVPAARTAPTNYCASPQRPPCATGRTGEAGVFGPGVAAMQDVDQTVRAGQPDRAVELARRVPPRPAPCPLSGRQATASISPPPQSTLNAGATRSHTSRQRGGSLRSGRESSSSARLCCPGSPSIGRAGVQPGWLTWWRSTRRQRQRASHPTTRGRCARGADSAPRGPPAQRPCSGPPAPPTGRRRRRGTSLARPARPQGRHRSPRPRSHSPTGAEPARVTAELQCRTGAFPRRAREENHLHASGPPTRPADSHTQTEKRNR